MAKTVAPKFTAMLTEILSRSRANRISANGASVAFFFVLAVFPGLAAAVALYSLLASPSDMLATMRAIEDVAPQPVSQVLQQQTERMVEHGDNLLKSGGTIGWVTGLGLFIWSANKGTKGLIDALNVIFDQVERRGFLRFTLYSMTVTAGAVLLIAATAATFIFVPLAGEVAQGSAAPIVNTIRWPLFFVIVTGVFAMIYRHGPTRHNPLWAGNLIGGAIAALAWILSSVFLSWYIAMVADLGLIYGSLTGMVALMLWAWLSSIAVLLGAEVDASVRSEWTSRSEARDNTPSHAASSH